MSSCSCTTCGASFALEDLHSEETTCTRCAPDQPTLNWGEFVLETRLGRGGMGEVWRARDKHGRRVALKILRTELGSASERFKREARAAQLIAHPLVARVLDAGTFEGRAYLVQEFIEGVTLRQALRDAPRSFGRALRCGAEIAEALAAAHAVGIVHRDVKPENVIIDPDGHAHLLDFGVARASAESSLTRTGELVGTPQYMAPEQLLEEPAAIGSATDMHALGLLLYEMLTGRSPFAGTNLLQTLRFVESLEPEAPSVHNSSVTPAIDALVLKLLSKDPAQRPKQASEVAELLRDAAPRVPEPRTKSRRWKFVFTFLVGTMFGGFIVWIWMIISSLFALLHSGSNFEVNWAGLANFIRENNLFVDPLQDEQLREAWISSMLEAHREDPTLGRLGLQSALDGDVAPFYGASLMHTRALAEMRLGYFHAARGSLQSLGHEITDAMREDLAVAEFCISVVLTELFPGGHSLAQAAVPSHSIPLSPDFYIDPSFAALIEMWRDGAPTKSAVEALVKEHPHLIAGLMLQIRCLTPRAERAAAWEEFATQLDWRSPERHLLRAVAACERADYPGAQSALRLAAAAGVPATRCEQLLNQAIQARAVDLCIRLSGAGSAP